MKRLFVLAAAVLTVGLSSAGAQDVKYNFAKDAKFSDYKTFKWVDAVKGSDQVDQITDNNLRQALEAELTKKRANQNRFRRRRSLRWLSDSHRH